LPIDAVVLPAASKALVIAFNYSPNPLISAIPLALSVIGPYASVANKMGSLASILSAGKAVP
jgi:hypothetical protein